MLLNNVLHKGGDGKYNLLPPLSAESNKLLLSYANRSDVNPDGVVAEV